VPYERSFCDAKSNLEIFTLRNVIIIIISVVVVFCTITVSIARDASNRIQSLL